MAHYKSIEREFMHKIFSVGLLLVSILIFGIIGCSNKKYIQYNGFYSNQQNIYAIPIFLRFYPEGTVTASLPTVKNHRIQFSLAQLDKDNAKECTIQGKYTLKGNKVTFKLIDKNGSADFYGEFGQNNLIVKAHSNINGKDSEEVYNFYPLK